MTRLLHLLMKRKEAVFYVGLALALASAAHARPRQEIDVAYGEHSKQRLDVYWKDGFKNAPIVVNIHGGGWDRGDKSGFGSPHFRSVFVEKHGCVLVAPNYRLTGDLVPDGSKTDEALIAAGRFDEQITDVFSAIAYVQQHAERFGGDPKRILVCGTSVGGHLSAVVAYGSEKKWLEGTPYAGATFDIVGWYGDSAPLDASVRGGAKIPFPGYAVPIEQLRRGAPPALMIVGTLDKAVLPENSYRFQEQCERLGVWNQLIVMEDGPHTSGRSVIANHPDVVPVFDQYMAWVLRDGDAPASGDTKWFKYNKMEK